MKKILKNKKYKNRILANNSEAFEASKKDEALAGHTRLSKYIRTTFSKTSLSLNKKPVYITNLRIHKSAVFFCRKSNKNPSTHKSSFLE
jgi:hypothetical protein